MSTLSIPASLLNRIIPADEPEIDPGEPLIQEHRQSIDFGDHAVADDAAIAEQSILGELYGVKRVSITRRQRRSTEGGVSDFRTEWSVIAVLADGRDACAIDTNLDDATAEVIARLR